jgi:hypothetical protein
MDRKEKWEGFAKGVEDGLPNLAKAFRDKDLQDSCADIEKYDGWIRCSTSLPHNNEYVLITDGKRVWIGQYEAVSHKGGKWSVVYDGAPPFYDTDIIAWMYMPHVPDFIQ